MKLIIVVLVLWTLVERGQYVEGVPCGPSGRICIDGRAECVNDECECINPPWEQGDGEFQCYRRNQRFCELRNDPSLRNYNDERVNFPYPCRFKLTNFTTQLWDQNRNILGTCYFVGHAFNAKVDGKFFNYGLDGALRMEYDGGPIVDISFRFFGTANNGNYDYDILADPDFLPDGASGNYVIDYNDAVNHVRVKQDINGINNQVIFDAERGCGIYASFVAYDVVLKRNQPQVPGSSVAVNCAHKPEFFENDNVMATGPDEFHGGELFELIAGLDLQDSVLAKAFGISIPQTQPNANSFCAPGTSAIQECNLVNQAQAFNACSWILKRERFIRCIDPSSAGDNILELFLLCAGHFCFGEPCNLAIDYINNNGCAGVSGIPELPGFLNGDHC